MSIPTPFKSGFIAIVGRPNVGKSTLMNRLLKQKVAAVSPRPQTTRRRQLGILTLPAAQVVFLLILPVYTNPINRLGEFMNEEASATLQDADVILWIVDGSDVPQEADRLAAQRMVETNKLPPVLLILNKSDQVQPADRPARAALYQELLSIKLCLWVSSIHGEGVDALLTILLDHIAEGPAFYDEDQVTDFYERDIASDLIRESALVLLRDEIPHEMAVRIDEYKERDEQNAYISATLFVSKESHKGIVIGKGAEMLKKIGTLARQQIEGNVRPQSVSGIARQS